MKKQILLAMVMILFVFWTASVFAEAPGIGKDSITLGAIVDKSSVVVEALTQQTYGQLAYFQKAYDDGIYKRKIKLITEDGAYNPAKHLAAGKLLLERDQVFCFVNSVGTSPTLALNVLLEAEKVPLVSVSAQARILGVPFKKYIFFAMVSYYDQARICVDYIMTKNPKAKIVMICQDDDMGNEGREGMLEQCKKYGIEPAGVVMYQRGAKDFSAPVLKAKSLNPDYVINHAVAPPGAAVMKEAHKLNWKTKWVCMSGTMGHHFIKLAGPSIDFAEKVEGVMLNYAVDGDTPGAVEYREAIKKYQPKASIIDSNTFWGYGWAKIAVEGLKRAEAANDLTREGMIKALETFKNFETGVYGPITYTSTYHGAPHSCLIVKCQGETWVPETNQWFEAK